MKIFIYIYVNMCAVCVHHCPVVLLQKRNFIDFNSIQIIVMEYRYQFFDLPIFLKKICNGISFYYFIIYSLLYTILLFDTFREGKNIT